MGDDTVSDRPLSVHERAAASRALEVVAEALRDERLATLPRADLWRVVERVAETAQRCALDLRRGHRAGDVDTLTRSLVAWLDVIPEGEPPEPPGVVPVRGGYYIAGRPER